MISRVCAFALAALAACLGPFGHACAVDSQQAASLRHIGVLLGAWLPEERYRRHFCRGYWTQATPRGAM